MENLLACKCHYGLSFRIYNLGSEDRLIVNLPKCNIIASVSCLIGTE